LIFLLKFRRYQFRPWEWGVDLSNYDRDVHRVFIRLQEIKKLSILPEVNVEAPPQAVAEPVQEQVPAAED
jgi:hypothetical protein